MMNGFFSAIIGFLSRTLSNLFVSLFLTGVGLGAKYTTGDGLANGFAADRVTLYLGFILFSSKYFATSGGIIYIGFYSATPVCCYF